VRSDIAASDANADAASAAAAGASSDRAERSDGAVAGDSGFGHSSREGKYARGERSVFLGPGPAGTGSDAAALEQPA